MNKCQIRGGATTLLLLQTDVQGSFRTKAAENDEKNGFAAPKTPPVFFFFVVANPEDGIYGRPQKTIRESEVCFLLLLLPITCLLYTGLGH